eukprot:10486551-Alexandrium_andersonii.AAC.1
MVAERGSAEPRSLPRGWGSPNGFVVLRFGAIGSAARPRPGGPCRRGRTRGGDSSHCTSSSAGGGVGSADP